MFQRRVAATLNENPSSVLGLNKASNSPQRVMGYFMCHVVHDGFSNFLEGNFQNVVRIGEMINAYRIFVENFEGRDHF
jgi:hypothetical protein